MSYLSLRWAGITDLIGRNSFYAGGIVGRDYEKIGGTALQRYRPGAALLTGDIDHRVFLSAGKTEL